MLRSTLGFFLIGTIVSCGSDGSGGSAIPPGPGEGGERNGDGEKPPVVLSVPSTVPVDAVDLLSIAISDDARVVVVAVRGSTGSRGTGDYKKNPLFAYERDDEGSFKLVCELPPLELADTSSQGERLAISADGTVITTTESRNGEGVVRGYRRSGACYTRLQDVLAVSSVDKEGTLERLVLSRDGTLSISSYPAFDLRESVESSRHRAGRIVTYTSSTSGGALSAPERRNYGELGSGLAYADGAGLVIAGEPQPLSPPTSYSEHEPVGHGSAYVFDAKSGLVQATLNAEDWSAEAHFGKQVAASEDGSLILVSAPDVKSVYAFKRSGSTWIQEGRIAAPGADIQSWGEDLAVSSDGTVALITGEVPKLGERARNIYMVRRDSGGLSTPSSALPSDAPAFGLFSMARAAKAIAIKYNDGGSARVIVYPLPTTS